MTIADMKIKLHEQKRKAIFKYGARTGGIQFYEEELIERLRSVYYGGIPASILLFIDPLTNGHCYDRSMLITMGMDDFTLVRGKISGLRLRYGEEKAGHGWVESGDWVYDTSEGLKFKKSLYYAMESPQVTAIRTKQECLDYDEYQDILNADIEQDKYVLPVMMPMIEGLAQISLLSEFLKAEIERFKKEVKYDDICREVEEDMKAKKG